MILIQLKQVTYISDFRQQRTYLIYVNKKITKMCRLTISEIQILPIKPQDGLVAFASCVINEALYLGNIAIYTSFSNSEGYRLVYPSKMLPTGMQINIFHPIHRDLGEYLTKTIINKFREIVSKAKQ